VLEPLRGYLMLAEQLSLHGTTFAEPWNFGPNDEDARPVSWIVNRLVEAWGEGASWELDGRAHPHEAHYLKLDISKARGQLDWQPRLRLADALSMITDWAKRRLQGEDVQALTLEQIQHYQTLTSQ
jgi:CDP-glucose 4,6-dehydratase